MIGIPYIQSLFKAILDKSLVIQGRFYLCPKYASELNTANLDQLILGSLPSDIKYPLALMLPPIKSGNFQFHGADVAGPQIGYNTYRISMLFLRPATYTAYNQPSQPLPNTALPTHTIADTWHDMSRCAENFLQVLYSVLEKQRLNGGPTAITIGEASPQSEQYVSDIGNDKVSGVLFQFPLLVNGGCDIEDYPDDFVETIVIPELIDTHPTHINT